MDGAQITLGLKDPGGKKKMGFEQKDPSTVKKLVTWLSKTKRLSKTKTPVSSTCDPTLKDGLDEGGKGKATKP